MTNPPVSLPAPQPDTGGGSSPLHLGALDGLRGLTALYVLVFHVLAGFDYWLKPLPSVLAPSYYLLGHGHSAVSVFILISGFCLMLPIARRGAFREGARQFLLRRATRILPTYYAALLVSIVLCRFVSPTTTGAYADYLPVTRRAVVYHLLLIHDFTYDLSARINGPFWSIAVEWRIYFFFPVLVWLWLRFGWRISVTVSVMLSAILTYVGLLPSVSPLINTQTNGTAPQYLGLFTMGMLAAGIALSRDPSLVRLREKVSWGKLSGVFAAATLIALNWHQISPWFGVASQPVASYYTDSIIALWITALLVALTKTREGVAQRLLNLRGLTFLGTFSFSIYLLHMPLLQLVWEYALLPMFPGRALIRCLLLLFVGIPLTLAACYGFYQIAERPVLRWRSRQ